MNYWKRLQKLEGLLSGTVIKLWQRDGTLATITGARMRQTLTEVFRGRLDSPDTAAVLQSVGSNERGSRLIELIKVMAAARQTAEQHNSQEATQHVN